MNSTQEGSDLISRSALIKMLRFKRRAVYGSGSMDDIARVIEDVEKFPAVKVGKAAHVRHGRWILRNVKFMPYEIAHECSCCGEWGHFSTFKKNYCPNCGAKMDGDESA